jgi:hypothetical protein
MQVRNYRGRTRHLNTFSCVVAQHARRSVGSAGGTNTECAYASNSGSFNARTRYASTQVGLPVHAFTAIEGFAIHAPALHVTRLCTRSVHYGSRYSSPPIACGAEYADFDIGFGGPTRETNDGDSVGGTDYSSGTTLSPRSDRRNVGFRADETAGIVAHKFTLLSMPPHYCGEDEFVGLLSGRLREASGRLDRHHADNGPLATTFIRHAPVGGPG